MSSESSWFYIFLVSMFWNRNFWHISMSTSSHNRVSQPEIIHCQKEAVKYPVDKRPMISVSFLINEPLLKLISLEVIHLFCHLSFIHFLCCCSLLLNLQCCKSSHSKAKNVSQHIADLYWKCTTDFQQPYLSILLILWGYI